MSIGDILEVLGERIWIGDNTSMHLSRCGRKGSVLIKRSCVPIDFQLPDLTSLGAQRIRRFWTNG